MLERSRGGISGNITHLNFTYTYDCDRMSVIVRLHDRAAIVAVAADRQRWRGILKEIFARWASVLLVVDAQLRILIKQHKDTVLRGVRRLRQVLIRRWRRLVTSFSVSHPLSGCLSGCLSVSVDIQFYVSPTTHTLPPALPCFSRTQVRNERFARHTCVSRYAVLCRKVMRCWMSRVEWRRRQQHLVRFAISSSHKRVKGAVFGLWRQATNDLLLDASIMLRHEQVAMRTCHASSYQRLSRRLHQWVRVTAKNRVVKNQLLRLRSRSVRILLRSTLQRLHHYRWIMRRAQAKEHAARKSVFTAFFRCWHVHHATRHRRHIRLARCRARKNKEMNTRTFNVWLEYKINHKRAPQMNNRAFLHLTRHYETLVFFQWRAISKEGHAMLNKMRKVMRMIMNKTLSGALQRWHDASHDRKKMLDKASRVVQRILNRTTVMALSTWSQQAKEQRTAREKTKRLILRIVNACLVGVFESWVAYTWEEKQRRIKSKQIISKIVNATSYSALTSWAEFVADGKEMRSKSQRAIQRMLNSNLAISFCQWVADTNETKQFRAKSAKIVARLVKDTSVSSFFEWQNQARQQRQLALASKILSCMFNTEIGADVLEVWRQQTSYTKKVHHTKQTFERLVFDTFFDVVHQQQKYTNILGSAMFLCCILYILKNLSLKICSDTFEK